LACNEKVHRLRSCRRLRHLRGATTILLLGLATRSSFAQAEKRFGEVCSTLTGRPTCRVCAATEASNWKCISDKVFEDVPGSSLPVPTDSSVPTLKKRSSSPDENGGSPNRNCPNWSSHFDQVLNPALLENLENSRNQGWQAVISQAEAHGQSISQQLSQGKQLEQSFQSQIPQLRQTISGLGGSDSDSPDPVACASLTSGTALQAADCQLILVKQMVQVVEGTDEILECYAGSGPSPSNNGRIIGSSSLANLNSKPIDDALDKLLDDSSTTPKGSDCESALAYVAPGEGLDKDLDVAVKQAVAHKQGLDLLQQTKADLLSDSWWASSTGPVVASQIKYVCDEVQDWAAALNPEGTKISEGKDALVKVLGVAARGIKAAYDNRQSVYSAVKAAKDAAAQELAEIDAEKMADLFKVGPEYGVIKALRDQQEYIRTLNEAAEYRASVQEQIERLDGQIAALADQISIDSDKQTAILALRQDVMQACVQKPITITPP